MCILAGSLTQTGIANPQYQLSLVHDAAQHSLEHSALHSRSYVSQRVCGLAQLSLSQREVQTNRGVPHVPLPDYLPIPDLMSAGIICPQFYHLHVPAGAIFWPSLASSQPWLPRVSVSSIIQPGSASHQLPALMQTSGFCSPTEVSPQIPTESVL